MEFKCSQEDAPKVEEKKESEDDSVKDAWDAESSEDEPEPEKTEIKQEKKHEPVEETKEVLFMPI